MIPVARRHSPAQFEAIAAAWEVWSRTEGAFFRMPRGEIVRSVP
ncbi:hypothetical protein [Corynebacterium vitaeruminis]|nr:hypothetical protein [Corynebacterium vitaeruminis]